MMESECSETQHVAEAVPENSVLVLDGMALLQASPLASIPATMDQLTLFVLRRILHDAKTHRCARVDFVPDRYPEVSIKNCERER